MAKKTTQPTRHPFSGLNVPMPEPRPLALLNSKQQPPKQPPKKAQEPYARIPYPEPRRPPQQAPVPEPVSATAAQDGDVTVSKRIAAYEVINEIKKIREISIISLVFVLAVYGVTQIDQTYGIITAVIYVMYAAFRLHKSNGKQKYLRYKYGV